MSHAPAAPLAKPAPINVMVVDDSAVIRGLITRTLEREGDIKVIITAADGQGAITLLKRYPVDIILLDVRLGIHDGRKICSDIKRNDLTEMQLRSRSCYLTTSIRPIRWRRWCWTLQRTKPTASGTAE